jgi:hypothetical protein
MANQSDSVIYQIIPKIVWAAAAPKKNLLAFRECFHSAVNLAQELQDIGHAMKALRLKHVHYLKDILASDGQVGVVDSNRLRFEQTPEERTQSVIVIKWKR